jgi:hypothetical protein
VPLSKIGKKEADQSAVAPQIPTETRNLTWECMENAARCVGRWKRRLDLTAAPAEDSFNIGQVDLDRDGPDSTVIAAK